MDQAAQGGSRTHPLGDPPDRRLWPDPVEAVGSGKPARGSRPAVTQWRKWRVPVNTMATLCASAAAITLSSLTEPPGWKTAVAPASIATNSPSGNGKKASDATTEPLV